MHRLILSLLILCATTLRTSAQSLSPRASALLLNRTAKLDRQQRPDTLTLIPRRTPANITTDPGATAKAFVRHDASLDPEALTRLGATAITRHNDRLLTITIPFDSLNALSQLPGVEFVRLASQPQLLLDKARSKFEVSTLHSRTDNDGNPYKGKGVIVGVVDIGMEYNHPAFRNPDGSLRFSRVWNQNVSGRRPEGFDYGAEFTSQDELIAAVCDTEQNYHATHVTNIAAGSPVNKYYGIAPEAELVFVSFDTDDTNIADGVKYIFNYADEVGKPCVINLSVGNHVGPHDGTSICDQLLDQYTGPGRIIVGSAGNERTCNMHISKRFTDSDTKLQTLLGYPSASSSKTSHIDIWANEGANLRVRVAVVDVFKGKIVAESKSFTPADKTDYALFNPDTGADCVFTISPMEFSENGRPEIYIISQVDNLSDSRKLAIIIEGDPGDEVHAWNVGGYDFVSGNLRGFTDGDNHCTVGELGGTPRNVISVGSYNSRSSYAPWWVEPGYELDYSSVLDLEIGKASFFSSLGPTADGRIKPDVAAPGALIISAVSKKYYEFDPEVTAERLLDDTTGEYYYYDVDVGTSMSAPMVTGTIATWLQARPNLTPDEARQVIIASAKHDKYAPAEPNNITGYGKIAASAGLTEVLRLNDLDGIEGYGASDDTPKVWLDADTRSLNIVTPSAASLTVTSLSGTRLLHRTLAPGFTVIDTASLPSGIHAVALTTSAGAVTSLISF